MKKLFYAYLFIFININFTINNTAQLCITPTFVGYIILLLALRELESESEEFSRLRPFAMGMAVYTGICWLLDLFGVGNTSTGGTVIILILSLISTVISLYILHCVIEGISDMEYNYGVDLGGDKLRSVFKVMVVAEIVAFVLLIIPALSVVAMLVGVVATIVLLVRLHAASKGYEDLEWKKWQDRQN